MPEPIAQKVIVRVFDVIGSPLGVSSDDGQKVHDKIAPLLREGRNVALSFEKIETIISAFLNAAIGQLYGEFPEEKIRELFNVQDISPEDLALLKRVVDNAKIYFKNRAQFDQAWREELGREE
jgi:hypothetical protein